MCVCVCVCVCGCVCVSRLDSSNHKRQCLAPLCTALAQQGGSSHFLAAAKQRGDRLCSEMDSRLSVQSFGNYTCEKF